MRDAALALPDGRTLAFTELGEPDGDPVLFSHGAPTSRLTLAPWEREFAARGLRVVTADRPGYGGSSPRPGRALEDWPADTARLADALGIERFAVAGHSSGGPYAVACAALLRDRVRGAVVLAGVTDAACADAWEGYFEAEREVMAAADERSAVARAAARFSADGSGLFDAPGLELPAPDAALLADGAAAAAMMADVAEAFRQGVEGYARDLFVQGRPWAFSPAAVTAPVLVAHGELDTVVPLAHSRHTAAAIPGAGLRILPGRGHLTAVSELPALCREVLRAAR